MFKHDHFTFFMKLNALQKLLLIAALLPMLFLTNLAFSQSQSAIPKVLKQAMISHTISRVSVSPVQDASDSNLRAKEGDFLTLGDTVRTGEDSVVRILFPDGTTETLCENTTYRVQESGSETYEGDDANRRENIIAALNRCNIRPRFIERCREANGFISGNSKAGERGKVGGLRQSPEGQSGSATEIASNISNDRNDGRSRFEDVRNSSRCTTGEQLFTNYVFVPQPLNDIQTVVVPTSVPEPTQTPVTVPENGGSPVK